MFLKGPINLYAVTSCSRGSSEPDLLARGDDIGLLLFSALPDHSLRGVMLPPPAAAAAAAVAAFASATVGLDFRP